MAISILSKTRAYPVPAGGEGFYKQTIVCAWTTTDITGTVPVQLRKVQRYRFNGYLQEPADDETTFLTSAKNGDGSIVLDTGQVLTFGRDSFNPTSGIKFSFDIEGYV
jgi:hypothetical protein